MVIDLEFHDYNGKPFREAYERVVAHLGVRAEECVLVEDTLRNLRVARQMGMVTVLVGERAEKADYVDFTVAHPAEVAPLLAGLLAPPAAEG